MSILSSILKFVISKWRECLIGALSITIYILYSFWPSPVSPAIQIQERVVIKEVEVVKTVYAKNTEKSKVTTTEKGKTVVVETEKVVEELKKDEVLQKTVDYSAKVEHNSKQLPSYVIGVTTDKDYNYRIIGGARLGSSPLTGILEYAPRSHNIAAGILYQF